MGNFWLALSMCLIAGLSTSIGSLAFIFGKDRKNFLAGALGFSAGVMIYVSFVEIFNKARDSLIEDFEVLLGNAITIICFFTGIVFVLLVDFIFSATQKHLNKKKQLELSDKIQIDSNDQANKNENKRLLKSGLLTAIAMAVHNFPEGLATFIAAYYDPMFAISIVVAISLHNIPEGIAVSVPVYYATGSKKKAFIISSMTGVAEPIGALIGYFLLLRFFSDILYGILFAAVAGMMICISIRELLPSAREYSVKYCTIGFILGMAVMAISLLLFL